MQQKFSGYWTPEGLCSVINAFSSDKLRKGIPSIISVTTDVENYFTTVIVVVYFTLGFAAFQDSWEMVVKKANKWMRGEEKKLKIDSAEWEAIAKKFLQDAGIISK